MCAKASCRAGSTETDEEDPIMTIPPELEARILRYYIPRLCGNPENCLPTEREAILLDG